MIVFDASTLVGAVLKADSIPERALLRAQESDVLALLDGDLIAKLPSIEPSQIRPRRLARAPRTLSRRTAPVGNLVEPSIAVNDCRHAKDDKYLELALAAGANPIVSSDADLLVLHPWRGIPVLSPADFLARADEVIE